MKKHIKVIAIFLVIAIILPGIVQATPIGEDIKIKRLAGASRVETAIEASKEVYKDGSDSVVLVGYSGEVDALGGTLLASAKDAPLLLTKRDKLSATSGYRGGN